MAKLIKSKISQNSKHSKEFPAETAGQKMVTELPLAASEESIAEVETMLLEKTKKLESINYIYVVDSQKRLKGVISIKEVFRAPKTARVGKMMKRKLVKVDPLTDQEKLVLLALEHNLKSIPVVDSENRLLGAVPSDALLEILHEEASEDLIRLGGTHSRGTEITKASAVKISEARLPWLLFSIIGGIISGSIIGVFKPTLKAFLVLSVYIPVMMDLGGSVGSQSATIFIKNLALGKVRSMIRYFWKEIRVGLIIALICAVSLSIVSLLWQKSLLLGLIVGLSILITIILATTIGIIIPWSLYKLNLDPAVGSGPFVTTIKDIISLLIYLNIASLMLKYFGRL